MGHKEEKSCSHAGGGNMLGDRNSSVKQNYKQPIFDFTVR